MEWSSELSLDDETRPLLGTVTISCHTTVPFTASSSIAKMAGSSQELSIRQLFAQLSWRNRMTAITAAFINFTSMACFAIMAPFLPLEAEQKGINSTTVGIIFACFEAVMFTSNIIFGRYLTTIGAKFTYLAGIFIGSTCTILFGMLQWCPPGTPFIVMAILCRCTEAVGVSMSQTASMAIIANEFPNHVATVMGLLETFVGLGLMAGPPLGGVLYELGGFYLPFVVIGVIYFLTGIIAAAILPKNAIAAPKDKQKLFMNFIKVPTTIVCGLCILTTSTMLTFLDPVFAQHLVSIDPSLANSQSLIGLIFLVEPSMYAMLSPFIGYLSDRASYPMPILAFGNVGFIIAYLFIGPCPLFTGVPPKQLWLTIFSYGMLGFFVSFCFMPAFSGLAKGCIDAGLPNDLDLYGLIAGFIGSAFNLGSFIGPILGGALTQRFSFEWAASITALAPCVVLIVLAIYGFMYWRKRLLF